MKNILLLILHICIIPDRAPAQTSRIEYTTIVKLNPGEEVVNLLSCWKPDGNNAPSQIVIRNPDKSYSTITGGIRKDNLTYEQAGVNNCNDNPYQVQKDSYSNIYRHPLPNGKFNLSRENKAYGTYDNTAPDGTPVRWENLDLSPVQKKVLVPGTDEYAQYLGAGNCLWGVRRSGWMAEG